VKSGNRCWAVKWPIYKTLSAVAGTKIDEVFLGFVVWRYRHFRAEASYLRNRRVNCHPFCGLLHPPNGSIPINRRRLLQQFGKAVPEWKCQVAHIVMGISGRVAENSTVVSTSTRNFPNRLGTVPMYIFHPPNTGSSVFQFGKIPQLMNICITPNRISETAEDTYRYLNLNRS